MKTAWQNTTNILNKTKTKKQFPEKFKLNAQLLTDRFEIANQFNIFFVNIGTKCIENIVIPPNKSYKDYLTSPCETSFNFTPVTEDGINIIILKLNSKMSSGRDGISNTVIKASMPIISKPLSLIINQVLNTGIFPDNLKIAKVVPLYKKRDDGLFTNYRPISLLSSVSKIFERVIFNQLIQYFDRYKLLYKSQYGFRKNHSTELAALELIDKVIHSMDHDHISVGIFVDLSP